MPNSDQGESEIAKKTVIKMLLLMLLAACAPQPWKQDPDVQAAKQDCAGLPQGEHYTCIERHAVDSLNPDVCRLTGMWVDDMCLQAVYEAANDPSICDRLYLSGVVPNCHAYYTAHFPTPTPAPLPTAFPGRLIYESGGDIWIVEPGQPPQVLLTDGSNPHLSLAGNRLLFFRANPELTYLADLWLADFTCPAEPDPCQVNERRLIGPTEFSSPLIYDLAWSPDGQTVALTTGSNAKTIYSEDLWLVDVETGNYRQVLDDGGGVPDYSPDGAWIALNMPYTGYQRGQLSLIAADGSGYRPLFDDLLSCEAKWLPDGVLIAGIVRLAQTTEAEDMTELWQVPVTGEPVCLTTIRAGRYFHWSADGQRLAYLADDPTGWLHIAQACTERSECGNGSGPVAVPGTNERTWPHSWSPGGQLLAVIHDNQYFLVSDDPNPALIPMPAPFWLWLDDESYLTAEWITDDPQADRGHFEVSRAWLDGRREFLFEAESLNGLAYRP